ncbi:MAG: serine/threonine protein kinase [Acidobacteria bacterium]|nr:serine/threonine protein kinase [Acidobacteriota bacterium]
MTDDDRDRIPGPSDDGVRREPSPAPDEEATRHSGAPPEAAHDAPTMGAARAGASRSSAASAAIPDSIGEYRILGKLGEGGMGVVYEAEQRDPRRVVALKVIRGGAFVDDDRVRMFQREVETLARLTHPNIGAIYESGRTEDGQHFFAMELVRGSTLSAHLATRPPVTAPGELEQRLRLFAKLASAVHHAHQRGVIHRDLKPSNIIVIEDTEARAAGAQSATRTVTPELKILDFGLARITDDDVRAASMITEVGVIKGTLPYMSPEQARGDGDAIDVRTDVYALGIILYEMIAGQRPYDVLKASLIEAVRVICEEPPRSVALSWGGSRRLDPDVETIIGKALEKEPDRRYASAAALADDVSRFLDSEPIQARPPSAAYQVRKFAKRHRPIVAGAGIAVASLVVA